MVEVSVETGSNMRENAPQSIAEYRSKFFKANHIAPNFTLEIRLQLRWRHFLQRWRTPYPLKSRIIHNKESSTNIRSINNSKCQTVFITIKSKNTIHPMLIFMNNRFPHMRIYNAAHWSASDYDLTSKHLKMANLFLFVQL